MPIRSIAYFSMEIALDEAIPTYSGGLGALAGDTIRSAADLRIPMVAVTLLHRKGYFRQSLSSDGRQSETPDDWPVEQLLHETAARAAVNVEGRIVHLRAWRYEQPGVTGYRVPVYFLDADLPENHPADRRLTDHLYGGDDRYRLAQEILLGIGGVRILTALEHTTISRFHMNEGHSSLLCFELLQRHAAGRGRSAIEQEDVEAVRERCVFTTHTPVPAGHDQFPLAMTKEMIGEHPAFDRPDIVCCEDRVNLTHLALNLSRYVNGVAHRHGEVSRDMFSGYEIDAITNGVHAPTWTAEPFQELFDHYIPGWRVDNFSLRFVLSVPDEDIWEAHIAAKRTLLETLKRLAGVSLDPDRLTIGFARRATPYKRSDLLFADADRLRRIAKKAGGLQLVFGGKAHPHDEGGKEMIRRIHKAMHDLRDVITGVYLPNYDLGTAGPVTSGVDVWLNTPQPPLEASGTSGMKAALNGVPSLSILDGWWVEGCIDGVTGWAIGEDARNRGKPLDVNHAADADSLYDRLERDLVPTFLNGRERFVRVMKHAIAINGSFFTSHRMLQQYAVKAYA